MLFFTRIHNMQMTGRIAKATLILGLILTVSLGSPARAMNQGDADTLAASLLKESQRHCAMISVPNCGSGELAIGFWNAAGGAGQGRR